MLNENRFYQKISSRITHDMMLILLFGIFGISPLYADLPLPKYSLTSVEAFSGMGLTNYTYSFSGGNNKSIALPLYSFGLSINPIYTFVNTSDYGISFLEHFDLLFYGSIDFNSGINFFDTSYTGVNQSKSITEIIEAVHKPTYYNIGLICKLNAFNFMTLCAGGGFNFGNDEIQINKFQITAGVPKKQIDSSIFDLWTTSFFYDVGAEIFMPLLPSIKLGFYIRQDFRESGTFNNASVPLTSITNNQLQYRGQLTLAIGRLPSIAWRRNKDAEDKITDFINNIASLDACSLNELEKRKSTFNSLYNGLYQKESCLSQYNIFQNKVQHRTNVIGDSLIVTIHALVQKQEYWQIPELVSKASELLLGKYKDRLEQEIEPIYRRYITSNVDPDSTLLFANQFGFSQFSLQAISLLEQSYSDWKRVFPKLSFKIASSGDTAFHQRLIGVQMSSINCGLLQRYGISSCYGVGIQKVMDNSPAEKVGLKPGMIIRSINGHQIENPDQVRKIVNSIDMNEMVLSVLWLDSRHQIFTKDFKITFSQPVVEIPPSALAIAWKKAGFSPENGKSWIDTMGSSLISLQKAIAWRELGFTPLFAIRAAKKIDAADAKILYTGGLSEKDITEWINFSGESYIKPDVWVKINIGFSDALAMMRSTKDPSILDRMVRNKRFDQWSNTNRNEITRIENWMNKLNDDNGKLSKLEERRNKFMTYQIIGEIENVSGSVAQIWGVAEPSEMSNEESNGYMPGTLYNKSNIVVTNFHKSDVEQGIIYQSTHCFSSKGTGKGKFGQSVDVYYYGPCSNEKTELDKKIAALGATIMQSEKNIEDVKAKINYDEMKGLIPEKNGE